MDNCYPFPWVSALLFIHYGQKRGQSKHRLTALLSIRKLWSQNEGQRLFVSSSVVAFGSHIIDSVFFQHTILYGIRRPGRNRGIAPPVAVIAPAPIRAQFYFVYPKRNIRLIGIVVIRALRTQF